MMYESLPEKPYPPLGYSISYPEAFHANRTRLLDIVRQAVMSATCGPNFDASFAKLSRGGSWERMYRGCAQVNLDRSSALFSETWPTWGTVQHGWSSELTKSVRIIYATEFSSWPTPTVTGNHNQAGISKKAGDGLSTAVAYSLWPTPTTRDYADGKLSSMLNVKVNSLLGRAVHWDGKQVGALNPEWVEWLMGFPDGWLDLTESKSGAASPPSRAPQKKSRSGKKN